MLRISSFLIIVFSLSGCAANIIGKTPTEVSKLENLSYGTNKSILENKINHPGIPLFKFYNNKNTYYITLYRPSNYAKSYLFVYENDKLISVVKTATGIKIWEENFGIYKHSVPASRYFIKIVNSLRERAISVNVSYISENEKVINPKDYEVARIRSGSISSTELYTIGSTWGIALFPYFMVAGAVTQHLEDSPEMAIETDFVEFENKEYYQNIIEKYGSVEFSFSINDVISKVGKPADQAASNGESILIYKDKQIVIYGFQNQKLKWIAFDYPIEINEENKP